MPSGVKSSGSVPFVYICKRMKISNESKVGVFAAIAITILILGYNFLKGQDLFTSNNTYYVVFEKVDGLTSSNPVYINGYKIGQVKSVEMMVEDNLKLLVTLEIVSSIDIPVNSVLKVYSADLFNNKAVELILGDEKKYAENKSYLNGRLEPGLVDNLNQITAPLREQMKHIMSGIDSTFNGPSGDSLKMALTKLLGTITKMDQTFQGIDQQLKPRIEEFFLHTNSIVSNIRKNNDQITSIMQNLHLISDSLKAVQWQTTISRVNSVMITVDEILAKTNRGEGTLGQLVNNDQLYNELKTVSKDLDALLVDMKKNPKRYVHFSVFGRKEKSPK